MQVMINVHRSTFGGFWGKDIVILDPQALCAVRG